MWANWEFRAHWVTPFELHNVTTFWGPNFWGKITKRRNRIEYLAKHKAWTEELVDNERNCINCKHSTVTSAENCNCKLMATTIKFKPLLPLSPLPKQATSPTTSRVSCKPISDPFPTLPISHAGCQRGNVAVSVAFNPQGNFDLSLFDDDGNRYKFCIVNTICHHFLFNFVVLIHLSIVITNI